MKYKYIKRVYNHDKTALKIDDTYTIEKDCLKWLKSCFN